MKCKKLNQTITSLPLVTITFMLCFFSAFITPLSSNKNGELNTPRFLTLAGIAAYITLIIGFLEFICKANLREEHNDIVDKQQFKLFNVPHNDLVEHHFNVTWALRVFTKLAANLFYIAMLKPPILSSIALFVDGAMGETLSIIERFRYERLSSPESYNEGSSEVNIHDIKSSSPMLSFAIECYPPLRAICQTVSWIEMCRLLGAFDEGASTLSSASLMIALSMVPTLQHVYRHWDLQGAFDLSRSWQDPPFQVLPSYVRTTNKKFNAIMRLASGMASYVFDHPRLQRICNFFLYSLAMAASDVRTALAPTLMSQEVREHVDDFRPTIYLFLLYTLIQQACHADRAAIVVRSYWKLGMCSRNS